MTTIELEDICRLTRVYLARIFNILSQNETFTKHKNNDKRHDGCYIIFRTNAYTK